MNCLCCEQPVKHITAGDPSCGVLPMIVGGHIKIEFGYGSVVHDCFDHPLIEHQAVICDACWVKKQHLVITVRVITSRRFEQVSIADKPKSNPLANHDQACLASGNSGEIGECTCTNSAVVRVAGEGVER